MYKNILLPVDLAHESSWRRALPAAIDYCKASGARLHVISVLPDFGSPMVASYFPENFEEQARQDAAGRLRVFIEEQEPDVITAKFIIAEGKAYQEILAAANQLGVDLIVMASHHPGLGDYLIGSHAERVVRHAKQSVLVVRD